MINPKIKYLIITCLCLSFISCPISKSLADPPKGKKLIKKLQKTFNDLKTFKCDFRMEFQWSLAGEVDITEGDMVLAAGDKFKYVTPQQITVSDGKTLWRYNSVSHQAIVENLADAETGVLPRAIIAEYPNLFEVKGVRESVIKGQDVWLLDLYPEKDDLGIKSLKIWLGKEDSITRRMEWFDMDDNRTTYILRNIVLDSVLDEDTFNFMIPENANIFDLR